MILILQLTNAIFQYYEKYKGTIIYFENRWKEAQIKKYILLTSKLKKAHKHDHSFCNI
jgi:hypothetical protein